MNQHNENTDTFEIKNNQQFISTQPTIGEPQVMVADTPLPVKKPKKLLIFTIILLLFLIIGGGATAYYFYFRITPEELADLMIDKMLKAKSFAYNGELLIMGEENFNIKMNGQQDSLDSQNKKHNLLINANIINPLGNLNPTAEIRWLKEDSFFKINLENLPIAGLDLGQSNNQWIKIDQNNTTTKNLLPLNQSNFPQKLTAEQLNQLKNLFADLNLFKNLKELEKEKINQITVRHLAFEISKQAVEKFIIDYYKNILNLPLNDRNQNELKEVINELPILAGEMWIGKKDFYLYQFKLPLELNQKNPISNINFIIQFNQYNESFNITPPASYKNLSEILNSLIAQTPPLIQSPNLDSDNDGLTDIQEDYYKTNKQNPDSDNDGYLDGEEVQNGYNPLGPGKLNQ